MANKRNRNNWKNKQNRKGNTGKPSNNGKDKEAPDQCNAKGELSNGYGSSADNDISWYNRNPVLLKTAGSIPFGYPVGASYKVGEAVMFDSTGVSTISSKYRMPGITRINFRPTPGVSTTSGSVVNVAAANLYSFIRQANSGAKNYDSNDLMLYILMMDSAYMFHAMMMRIYGVINNYMTTSRYLPEDIAKALGIRYSDFAENMADFRAYINNFGARISAFAVPNDMAFFTRHRWMCSNIYADEPSLKAQLYAFVPEGVYQFGYDSDSAGKLSFTSFSTSLWTPSTIKAYGNNLISAFVGDEDANIISGDLLKAYGNNLVTVPYISDDYLVQITYSSEVLEQIHNIKSLAYTSWKNWDITQSADKSYLIFDPYSSTLVNDAQLLKPIVPSTYFIDSKDDVVTPEAVMIMTRLTAAFKCVDSDGNVAVHLDTCGSEVVMSMTYFTKDTGIYGSDGNLVGWRVDTEYYFDGMTVPTTSINWSTDQALFTLLDSGASDRRPLITLYIKATNGASTAYIANRLVGQRNNTTIIHAGELQNLHETALLSMYNVPAMGARK